MSKVIKEIVIDIIIYEFAPYLIAAVGVEVGVSVDTLATVIKGVQTIAVLKGLSAVGALLEEKQAGQQLSNGAQVEYTGTVSPRTIIYGTCLVGGMNALLPLTHGTNNNSLDQVLVHAGHEVDAIGDFYLGQDLVASGAIGAITGATTDGAVTTGAYANVLWIRRYLGTSSQTVDFILNAAYPAAWPSTSRGRGIAYSAIEYLFDTTKYRNGKPEIRTVIRGKKCYDPRLDPSPGVNTTNPSYIAWTNNPALHAIDYLLDNNLGVGEATTRIEWTLAAAAASICEEACNIPGGGTQHRYTCSIVLDCTAPYADNLAGLAGAMMGNIFYSGGKWLIYAGKWQTPGFALSDDDLVGSLAFRTATPYQDRYNAVRGQFIDSSALYQPIEYPVVRVPADETADGEGPVWKEVNFPTCTNTYEAQRNAIILQKISRRKKQWVGTFALTAYKIRPGESGTLTFTELGLSAQSVRCTGWQFTPAGQVQLTLDEAGSSDWADPLSTDYAAPGAPSVPTPSTTIPDPLTGFAAASSPAAIFFNWTLPSIWHARYQVELLEAATNNIAGASVVWAGSGIGTFLVKSDLTVRYYWVRARNLFGNTVSATTPAGATSGVAAAAGPVDPSTNIVAAKGNTPPSLQNVGFTYTSTTTSVTISWATMTNYRADGSSYNITSGSQAVTGLTNGHTYYTYAYVLESAPTVMLFVTGTTGSTGSPAICYDAASTTLANLAAAAAVAYVQSAIFIGKISTATGGGGGGGGGGGACPHPDWYVDTPDGQRLASELKPGDRIYVPGGNAPILSIRRRPTDVWVQVETSLGAQVVVSKDHRFLQPDGEMVAAADLKLGDILAAGGSTHAEICSLRLVRDSADAVGLEIPAPHIYSLRQGAPLSHNIKP